MSRLRAFLRAFVVVCVLTVTWGSIYIGYRNLATQAPPPFEYSAAVYQPQFTTLCPGDHLRYTIGFRINRTPTLLVSGQSWISLDRNTVDSVGPAVILPYARPIANGQYTLDVVVPPLKPGRYTRVVGAGEYSSKATVYEVPFTVPQGCK